MRLYPLVFAIAVTLLLSACLSQERKQIRIVGSSTVYPFVTTAAEQFGQDGNFKTPIVEATGTGGGFKLFCSGTGLGYPDINNASRSMTQSEKEMCQKNGITHITEIAIGYDGIVLANAKTIKRMSLSKQQIFFALSREVPDADGTLKENTYQTWKQVDPSLPDVPIMVYGPPPTSGTRDAFVELVMEKGCEGIKAFATKYPDSSQRKKACALIREDGKYVEAGEDDNLIIQKLITNKSALGLLGYGFLEENLDKVQGSIIEGIEPSIQNIENGSYKVARSLYVYIKGEHVGLVPGIPEFANELVSEAAIGTEGYLTIKGLLPLHDTERKKAQKNASELLK